MLSCPFLWEEPVLSVFERDLNNAPKVEIKHMTSQSKDGHNIPYASTTYYHLKQLQLVYLQLKEKLEKTHEAMQKARSQKQLEQAKQANIEKLVSGSRPNRQT
ncbi:hypothetical protein DPMN_122733 [Dreissena polymorpha]|uniref:Uncharacterized protein n=1 Tax=Dreissena polymorpha TaxID=45954 RepID=A0A9D4GT08_DREPO|nr:hypothetical protein DPMN_122733 [Dreissena polymorpha]